MLGSLWEWCQDVYEIYLTYAVADPRGPTGGQYRSLRGGSWIGYTGYVRASVRIRNEPAYRFSGIGFRGVREADS